jgi:hypothetical protein
MERMDAQRPRPGTDETCPRWGGRRPWTGTMGKLLRIAGFAGTVPVALTSWASWAGPKKKPLDTDANRGVYFGCLAKR